MANTRSLNLMPQQKAPLQTFSEVSLHYTHPTDRWQTHTHTSTRIMFLSGPVIAGPCKPRKFEAQSCISNCVFASCVPQFHMVRGYLLPWSSTHLDDPLHLVLLHLQFVVLLLLACSPTSTAPTTIAPIERVDEHGSVLQVFDGTPPP